MQMLDPGRAVQGGSAIDRLAACYSISPAQAEAVMRAVGPEFGWHLERNTLSRGGLADLIDALGHGHHVDYLNGGTDLANGAVHQDGKAILGHVLGSKDRSRALAARAARRSGLDVAQVEAMLPALAAITMANLSVRAKASLGDILARVPPQGRFSRGSPHADLSDIVRRRCGAGPYSPRALPRVVRRALGRAAGFGRGGVGSWYVRFMLMRPVVQAMRTVVKR
jgi:hypothetical protein